MSEYQRLEVRVRFQDSSCKVNVRLSYTGTGLIPSILLLLLLLLLLIYVEFIPVWYIELKFNKVTTVNHNKILLITSTLATRFGNY
jgi:hypothetical protein